MAVAAIASASTAGEAAAQQSTYDRGVEARLAGDNERAVELLASAAAAEPANADAQLQYGLALMALGRRAEAERAFRRTLQLAPNYQDAKDALARLEGSQASAGELKWQADFDGSYSAVEKQEDWKEGRIYLRYEADPDTAVAGGVEASRRFGRDDVYGELRLDRKLGGGSSFWVSVGGTPDADFRPKWQLGLGGSARLTEGPMATVLTLEARQARFRSGDIQTLTPGIEQYVGGGSWLTARMINIFDENGEHHAGWLARGDFVAAPGLRLFAGAADAPDVSEGIVTDTFALFGGASIDLNERQALRISLAHEERDTGADRLQLGLGLGFRF